MRVAKKSMPPIQEADMTPMIDMTFQLIAFFMVLINFNAAEQIERVMLPSSVLARPAKEFEAFPITLHMVKDGTVVLGGADVKLEGLRPLLNQEVAFREQYRDMKVEEILVIIRAHRDAPTGLVQALIAKCQESQLEKFALRAKGSEP